MIETFNPQERIRKKKDFLLLYKEGKRYKGKYFNLIYFPNNLSCSRMAVIVSKKIGKAVNRNKIKRWMRELFRKNKALLKEHLDILIIPKKEIQEISWTVLRKSYFAALESIWQKNKSV